MRLAAEIGDEEAARAHSRPGRAGAGADGAGRDEYARLVYFAPADARDEVARWLPAETLVAQRGEDLGRRMEAAFADAFARGAERVALIGTDVPRFSRALVIEALSALGSRPVALGPGCLTAATISS